MEEFRFAPAQQDPVYDAVRAMILDGSLAPGARVVESELAEHLGVSRTPVRGALHRLQQGGYLLASSRGRKTRLVVAPLTKEDGQEIYRIAGALDGLVSWHAAQLPARERERLAARMEKINDELEVLGEVVPPDLPRLLELHAAFHSVVFEVIQAPRLQAFMAATQPQADRYRRIYSRGDHGQQKRSVAEHRGIMEAIRAGDATRALILTQEHAMHAAVRLARIIEVLGEQGKW